MPTYAVTVRKDMLNDTQKDAIAALITRVHAEVTGAPSYYVQVIFYDDERRRYVGGRLMDSQIWIRADIRSGRTTEQCRELLDRLVAGIAEIAGIDPFLVWIYLNFMEPEHMSSFGGVLPGAGEEDRWLASLPQEARDRLARLAAGD